MLVQKLHKKEDSLLEYAKKYFAIISIVNDLGMTERELQLLSFHAVKGNIYYKNIKEEFCKIYNTSPQTINNMVSRLRKLGVLIKDGNIKLFPSLNIPFAKHNDIMLQIKLSHES